jgi:hypothetical protein
VHHAIVRRVPLGGHLAETGSDEWGCICSTFRPSPAHDQEETVAQRVRGEHIASRVNGLDGHYHGQTASHGTGALNNAGVPQQCSECWGRRGGGAWMGKSRVGGGRDQTTNRRSPCSGTLARPRAPCPAAIVAAVTEASQWQTAR